MVCLERMLWIRVFVVQFTGGGGGRRRVPLSHVHAAKALGRLTDTELKRGRNK